MNLGKKRSSSVSIVLGFAALAGTVALGESADKARLWEPVGPGGGGRLHAPAMAPGSPVLLLGSDMQTSYRSADNGHTWRVLSWHRFGAVNTDWGQRSGAWAFNPADPREVWAGTHKGMLRSADRGETWTHVPGPWDDVKKIDWQKPNRGPHQISFSQHRPDAMVAVFNALHTVAQRGVFLSDDHGRHWRAAGSLPWEKKEIGLAAAFNDGQGQDEVVLVTNRRVHLSLDGGRTWDGPATNPTDGTIRGASFGYDPRSKGLVLYVTTVPKTKAYPNVFRSDDAGRSWTRAGAAGIDERWTRGDGAEVFKHIAACRTQPSRVYMVITPEGPETDGEERGVTVFRSDDGGQSWRPTLVQRRNRPGYNVTNDVWTQDAWGVTRQLTSLCVDTTDPDRLMVTNMTGCYYSDNGGESWRAVHAKPMVDGKTPSGGVLELDAWKYLFDPLVPSRHYLANGDFGGWMSEDGGATWQQRTEGNPWFNNVYDVAFDADTPGRMWSASSLKHGIPRRNLLNEMLTAEGGVCRSDDGGKTWRAVGQAGGLPSAAMVDLLNVPGEGDQPDRLYVAAINHGVFVSTDGGDHWEARNGGLDKGNLAMLRLGRGPRGRLFAMSTMRFHGKKQHPGSLYVSDDDGGHWDVLFRQADVPYLLDYAIDPRDPERMAITALARETNGDTGGIWISEDGGERWTRRLTGAIWTVAFSPDKPGRVYAGSRGHGLMVSDDHGRSWWSATGFPCQRVTSVSFDPASPDDMYVTTKGATAWRAKESLLVNNGHPSSGMSISSGDLLMPGDKLKITNGKVTVDVVPPNLDHRFYRDTRFDRSGIIAQARYQGHTYFGASHHSEQNPSVIHAARGPVDEFGILGPPGYEGAEPGQSFMKIGVGHLSRIDDRKYHHERTYPIADPGTWQVDQPSANQLVVTHTLPADRGYGYQYQKTIELDEREPVLRIHHRLVNQGSEDIDTDVYCHNFVRIDEVPVGPSYRVGFAFPVQWEDKPLASRIKRVDDATVSFHPPSDDFPPTVYAPFTRVEAGAAAMNQFDITESTTNAGVTISGDRPLDQLVLFASSRAVCPEPFLDIYLEPGQATQWTHTYTFVDGE